MSFDAPQGFLLTDCQSYCTRVADGTHETPNQAEVGKRLATSKNIKDGRLKLENSYLIPLEEFEEINKRSKVDQWDILISMIGTVGEVCLIDTQEPDFAIKNVGLLKCGDEYRGKWLYYYLRSPLAKRLIEARKKGTTQQYISLGEIRRFPVIYPETHEQMSNVVGTLSALDDRITLLRETNATLEAIAQALFKSWFVDFDPVRAKQEGRAPEGMSDATAALFPDSFEESELGLVPKGWRVETLGTACSYLNRGLSPKYTETGGILVLNQKCIRDFSVNYSKGRRHDPQQRKVEGRELVVGDVLVNSTGVGTLGRVAQVLLLPEAAIVDSHVTILRTGSSLSWPYLGQFMARKQPEIEAMGEGSTGQTELSRTKLANIPILVPSEAVLRIFDDVTIPLKERVAVNETRAQTLAALRDTLLPRLISGQLRLPEAEALIEEATA